MPLILSKRNPSLRERMDDPSCDPARLQRTYRQFVRLNRLVSGWDRVYRRLLRPLLSAQQTTTLLDVGCGGADIPRRLLQLARRDGLPLQVHAIDTDQRAIDYARTAAPDDAALTFEACALQVVAAVGRQFDIVTCNHLLHHLDEDAFDDFVQHADAVTGRRILCNDIERSDLGYVLFAGIAPLLFRRSFTVGDGLTSIRRCYRRSELLSSLPPGWQVDRLPPFRLVAWRDL